MFSLGGLKALTNGNMKIHKVLALPSFLEEDSIYFVKNGVGADLYMVSNDGDAIKVSSGVDYGLTLGETSSTAYQGDRGKFAYDHALSPHVANQTDIGLGHVNNTSDLNKPVSTATQAALDALTKADVGLGNVDNTSDIDKPVSTLQQAAIDAAGGSSFDQDLNTTDSPTFATLTTTNTIATDVFAVDVGATGTVTAANLSATDVYATNIGADNVDVDADITTTNLDATGTVTADEVSTNQINSPNSFISFQPSSFERLQITTGDIRPNSFGNYDLGRSTNTFNDCHLHGALKTVDVDATGTVTADEVNLTGGGIKLNGSTRVLIRSGDTLFYRSPCPSSNEGVDLGVASRRWLTTHTVDLDATGTVTAGEVSTDTFQIASGVYQFKVGGTAVAKFTPGNAEVRGNHVPTYDDLYNSGAAHKRWGTVFAVDVDATGTVTAGGFVGTPQTLTDAATITYDLANGHNAKLTLVDDRTLALPTNLAEGASGVLTLAQDAGGGRELTLAAGWFVSAGSLDDISALGANEQAQITWYAYDTDKVNATILPLQ